MKVGELEMKFFRDSGICKVTKWLDVSKSDDIHPNIQSRMVRRQLKLDYRLDLFAATPLLEALGIIGSISASHQRRRHGRPRRASGRRRP